MADEKPPEKLDPTKPVPVSDEDVRASFAGPAFHTNKMFLTIVQAGVRLAFMEALGDKVPPSFRTAIVLSFPDAIALRDLLTRQLKDIEAQLQTASAVEAAAKDNVR